MPNKLILLSGKKFMWDGVEYPSGESRLEAMKKYKDNGFEVEPHEEEGKAYLYTRRVVQGAVSPSS